MMMMKKSLENPSLNRIVLFVDEELPDVDVSSQNYFSKETHVKRVSVSFWLKIMCVYGIVTRKYGTFQTFMFVILTFQSSLLSKLRLINVFYIYKWF